MTHEAAVSICLDCSQGVAARTLLEEVPCRLCAVYDAALTWRKRFRIDQSLLLLVPNLDRRLMPSGWKPWPLPVRACLEWTGPVRAEPPPVPRASEARV